MFLNWILCCWSDSVVSGLLKSWNVSGCSCVSICMCIRSPWSSNTLQMGGCGFLELEIFSTALDAIAVQQIILEKQDTITPPTHIHNYKIWTLNFIIACLLSRLLTHQKATSEDTNIQHKHKFLYNPNSIGSKTLIYRCYPGICILESKYIFPI